MQKNMTTETHLGSNFGDGFRPQKENIVFHAKQSAEQKTALKSEPKIRHLALFVCALRCARGPWAWLVGALFVAWGAWGPGRVKHCSRVGGLGPWRLGPWAWLVAAMLRVVFVYRANL